MRMKGSMVVFALQVVISAGIEAEAQEASMSFIAEGEAEAEAGGEASAEETDDVDLPEPEGERRGGKGGEDGDGGRGGARIERPLLLTRHTMEIGGEIGLASGVNIPHNSPGGDATGGGVFFFSPQMGYFVIDNLELLFELNVRHGFGTSAPGDIGSADWTFVGFAAGVEYVFDFHVICLYIGGLIGPTFAIPQGAGPTNPYFTIRVPFGIMFPFNRHVALNAGMVAQFDIYISSGQEETHIYFPIGYFGIRGFFNLFDD